MRNIISLTLAVVFSLGLLVGSADALTIYTEESPPANFIEDGKLTGVAVQLVQEAQKRMGDITEIQVVPWARGYAAVQEEADVALFSTTRTESRESLFQWAGPLMRISWVLVARKGSGLAISSLEDAKKVHAIGTYKDDAREQFLIKEGFTNLDSASSGATNMKKLAAGRIDLLISNDIAMQEAAVAAGVDPNELEIVYTIKSADLYMAFSKQTDPAVPAKWQETFNAMAADGSFKTIYTTWFPGAEPPLQ